MKKYYMAVSRKWLCVMLFVVSLALLALVVFLFTGEDASRSTASTVVDIDPACLWPVLDGGMDPDAPPVPTSIAIAGCAPAGATLASEDGWTRLSFDGAGDDGQRRYTGVRLVWQVTGALALRVYDNGGGSGVFSSLITGKMNGAGDRLTDVHVYGFGDRCNGGLADVRVDERGRLRATANMTPWDILMTGVEGQSFDAQWAAGQARFGEAFTRAPSCAVCCSTVVREYEIAADGMRELGLRYGSAEELSPRDGPLARCLEDAVRRITGPDGLLVDEEEAVLGPAIAACAAKVNSN